MKTIINTVFKAHILLFKYPSRSHVRISIQNNFLYDLGWRVGMLYVCGEDLNSISEWFSISKEEVKSILNELVKGVWYA